MLKNERAKRLVTVTRKRRIPKKETKASFGDRSGLGVAEQEYRMMVAETAYFLAEQRGFTEDGILDDWLRAEELVQRRLQGRSTGAKTAELSSAKR